MSVKQTPGQQPSRRTAFLCWTPPEQLGRHLLLSAATPAVWCPERTGVKPTAGGGGITEEGAPATGSGGHQDQQVTECYVQSETALGSIVPSSATTPR